MSLDHPLERGRVVNDDIAEHRRGDQLLAIGAECQSFDIVGMVPQSQDLLPSSRIPELDCCVITSRGKSAAVRAEREAPDGTVVTAQTAHLMAGIGIPKEDLAAAPGGRFAATRGQPVPVGAEGHLVDGTSVPAEGSDRPSCLRIPEAYCLVPAGRGEAAAIGVERYTMDSRFMPFQ